MIDVVFVFQAGLAVSLALASQTFLETQSLRSPWSFVAVFFLFCLSGATLFAYNVVSHLSLPLYTAHLLLVCAPSAGAAALARFRFDQSFLWCLFFATSAAVLSGCVVAWLPGAHPELAKLVLVSAVFVAAAWSRCRSPAHFWHDLSRSALIALLWWPVTLLGAAVFFLLASTLTDAMGVSHTVINPFVFYGIFYVPFGHMLLLFFRRQNQRCLFEDSIV